MRTGRKKVEQTHISQTLQGKGDKQMKKTVAGILLVVWMFTLCSVAVAQEEDELRIAVFWEGASQNYNVERLFYRKFPDKKITYVLMPMDQFLTTILAGEKLVDVVVMPYYLIKELAHHGAIENLYDIGAFTAYPDGLSPNLKHLLETEGKMYFFPKEISYEMQKVNAGLLKTFGLEMPQLGYTYQDFYQEYVVGFNGDTNEDGLMETVLMYTEDYIIDQENYVLGQTLEEEDSVRNIITDILSDYVNIKETPEQMDREELIERIKLTRAIHESGVTAGPYQVLFENNPEKLPKYDAVFTGTKTYSPYVPFGSETLVHMPCVSKEAPQIKGNMQGFCVLKQANNKALATEFVKLLASEECLERYDDEKGIFSNKEPVKKTVARDSSIFEYNEQLKYETLTINPKVNRRYISESHQASPKKFEQLQTAYQNMWVSKQYLPPEYFNIGSLFDRYFKYEITEDEFVDEMMMKLDMMLYE